MIDLGNATDIARLFAAIEQSRQALRPFRENRIKMLREFVGSYYNNDGSQLDVLVNLLNITAEVYTIGLAANNPRVRITSPRRDLWAFAARYQKAINNYLREMRFAETMQRIVMDAFFTIGVAKVFQGASDTPVQLEDDVWADPGRPYISRISLDDYGLDMSVKDIRRCRFQWDEYRVSWESVRKHPAFNQREVKKLAPTSKWERGEEQANQITSGSMVDDDEYEPMVDLMDVWLPELQCVAVFSPRSQTKPLAVIEDVFEGGPYLHLSFLEVPDNVMPSSPGQNILGLHLLYNGLLRKQSRQARRQKINPIYRPVASEDADRLRRHDDGEWVKVADPTAVGVLSQGGVDNASVAFGANVLSLFERAAGNLQAKAGLGPSAGTVGQEELIAQAVDRREAHVKSRTHAFTARAMQALGYLAWEDPQLEIPDHSEYAPGTGVYVDRSWSPDHREGDFWEYEFDIHPDSMQFVSSEAALAKFERSMATLMQLYPAIQASGGGLDGQELVRLYAEKAQEPDLERLFTFAVPASSGMQDGAGMPAQTTRSYVRRNVATGGSADARALAQQQAWAGGDTASQGVQMAVGGK